ncbi:MAG TPA: heparan-alpha-glucosaminide N-acetyltransferase domain-containing protein, partial [Candidatus Eremiobacteraeota bacterium]|nr:heparan-alpha-glucosaminide N-acetyltransferase domain-containing protein [Candidatus Eremiobacteraeota bacterium]
MKQKTRLLHIDWIRGLAVFMMIRGHVVNAFLAPFYRDDNLFKYWQFVGGYTAPTFLFVAGLCLGLSYTKLDLIKTSFLKKLWLSVKRGFYIMGVAFSLRILLYLQWLPYSDWKSIFKVDILNNIGLSLILLGFLYVITGKMKILCFTLLTILIGFLTPILQVEHLLNLPWFIRDYIINTSSDFGHFPLFPYFVFMTSGIATGIIQARYREDTNKTRKLHILLLPLGIVLILSNLIKPDITTSIFSKVGFQLLLLSGCYFLCLNFNPQGFSFMRLMGRHSLLIYYVHIILVYGRFSQNFQQSLNWP